MPEQAAVKKTPQWFQSIIAKTLKVGLKTKVLTENLSGISLDPKFGIKEEEKIDSLTKNWEKTGYAFVRHPATTNDVNLFENLLLNPDAAQPLTITFGTLPTELKINQQLNFRQSPGPEAPGLAFGRFTMFESRPEKPEPFYIRKDPSEGEKYLNLDCFSKSPAWNPLFVKYHLSVVPSLQKNEYGYLRIDVAKNENQEIVVTTSRANELDIPEFLKTAKTFPY